MNYPCIKKINLLQGKNVFLRNATISDAEFIFLLRQEQKKGKYLSSGSKRIEDQILWLKKYTECDDQAYFIICNKNSENLGCLRMYEPQQFSYCWGSWLMIDGQNPLVSIESVLLIYSYGIKLGFQEARIDVKKENYSVVRFHEKFCGAKRVMETEDSYYYVMDVYAIDTLLKKHKHFLE